MFGHVVRPLNHQHYQVLKSDPRHYNSPDIAERSRRGDWIFKNISFRLVSARYPALSSHHDVSQGQLQAHFIVHTIAHRLRVCRAPQHRKFSTYS